MSDRRLLLFDIDGTLPPNLPALPNMQLTAPNDHTLQLEMPRSEDLNGVFAALDAAGVRVRSMRTSTCDAPASLAVLIAASLTSVSGRARKSASTVLFTPEP